MVSVFNTETLGIRDMIDALNRMTWICAERTGNELLMPCLRPLCLTGRRVRTVPSVFARHGMPVIVEENIERIEYVMKLHECLPLQAMLNENPQAGIRFPVAFDRMLDGSEHSFQLTQIVGNTVLDYM